MSFFGSSEKPSSASSEDEKSFAAQKTGGQIDVFVNTLLANANDKDEHAKLSISRSLHDISINQPTLVVTSCVNFIFRNREKIELSHRVQVLRILKDACEDVRSKLTSDVATNVIRFAGLEMTCSKEAVSDWQGAACAVLVSLGCQFPNQLMDELIRLFKPGQMPHYFVIRCLADFAGANPFAVAPRLREVFSRVIPVMGSIKDDPTKWAFTNAIGRFAEAVTHFIQNAPVDAKLDANDLNYSNDFNMMFDVILVNWINSKETKARLSVVETLGYFAPHLGKEFFGNNVAKVCTTLTMMYKKELPADHLSITMGLYFFLTTAVVDHVYALDAQLQLLLNTLHPLVGLNVDYKQPATVKNLNELLRCFEVLLSSFLDQVLAYVTNRLQSKIASERYCSLVILRHLVNSKDSVLGEHKLFIVSSLQLVLDENVTKNKKAILQLIVSLADNGYLSLSGGENLVSYLVRQSSISQDLIDKESSNLEDTLGQVKSASDHILHVLSTKVKGCNHVLYPFLLECLKPVEFGPGISAVCKAVKNIIPHADPIEWSKQVNLPKPLFILARLLLVLTYPFGRYNGISVLQCLEALSPILDSRFAEVAEHIPALVSFLSEHTIETLPVSKWDDVLLKLVKEYVNVLEGEQLITELVDSFQNCLVYAPPISNLRGEGSGGYKRACLRYMGAAISALQARDFVRSKVDYFIDNCNFKDEADRYGVSQACALVARTHIDLVLERIGNLIKRIENVKTGSFFGIGDSKEAEIVDYMRATVALMLGYVAAYVPPDLVVARADLHILNNMTPLLTKSAQAGVNSPGSQAHVLRETLVKSIDLIGKSLMGGRLSKLFIVKTRDSFLSNMLTFSKLAANCLEMRVLCVNAISTLVLLDPPVPDDLAVAILEIFSYLELDSKEIVEMILSNVSNVVTSMIQAKCTTNLLAIILQKLEYYLVSANSIHRRRACQIYLVTMKKFIARFLEISPSPNDKGLNNLGSWIAGMVPRVNDSNSDIRSCAIECLQALLYLDQLIKNPNLPAPNSNILLFTGLRTKLEEESHLESRNIYLVDVSALISNILDIENNSAFLLRLFHGLADIDMEAARGVSCILEKTFKDRGAEVAPVLVPLLTGLLASLSASLSPSLLESSLVAVTSLVEVHFAASIDWLLTQNCSSPLTSLFATIARRSHLTLPLLNHLLSVINETPFSEDKPAPVAKAATFALNSLFNVSDIQRIMPEHFCAVLSSLLLRVGSAFGDTSSSDEAIEALLTFLKQFLPLIVHSITAPYKDKGVAVDLMKTRNYESGIAIVVECICAISKENMRPLFEYLLPFATRNYVGHRSTVCSIFSAFIVFAGEDMPLLRKSISVLLPRVADKMPRVRTQALIGLGNLPHVWNAEVATLAGSILAALMTAMEDSVDIVAAQGVKSAITIVDVVDEMTMSSMIVNICFRMRPAFDRSEPSIRASACTLFGHLVRFGVGVSSENVNDQIHTNMPILLVHLNDEDEQVRKACGDCLLTVATMLNVADFVTLIKQFIESPYDYDGFLESVCPILVREYISTPHIGEYLASLVSNFRSAWNVIRASAVLSCGFIISSISMQGRKKIDILDTCQAMVGLMKEPSAIVRSKAAKAMSFLHSV